MMLLIYDHIHNDDGRVRGITITNTLTTST